MMINIGKRIKEIREKNNLTQEELSLKCDISRVSITRYENGTRTPDYSTLCIVAKALKASISDLLDEEKYNLTLFYDENKKYSLDISKLKYGDYVSIDIDEEKAEEIALKLGLELELIPF